MPAARSQTATQRIRILVSSDHDRSLAEELRSNTSNLAYDVLAIAQSKAETYRLAEELKPDLLLAKPRLEKGFDGIDVAIDLRARLGIPVVFIEDPADEQALGEAMRTQPFGFIPRRASGSELEALLTVLLQRWRLVRDLEERTHQQEAVAEMGREALAARDLQWLMELVAERVTKTLGSDYTKILEIQAGTSELLLRAGTGWKPGLVGSTMVSGGTGSLAGFTILTKRPVVVQDLRSETRFQPAPFLLDHGVVSGMSVIVSTVDGAYGVLGTHSRESRTFTQNDVAFLEAAANVLGMAIDRWRAEGVIREMSTPVLPIGERLILVPLVGTLDAQRAVQLRDTLLTAIRQYRVRIAILDLTGIASLNADVAAGLDRTILAAQLLGSRVILCGISSRASQTLVGIGATFPGSTIVSDLRSAVELAGRILAPPASSDHRQVEMGDEATATPRPALPG